MYVELVPDCEQSPQKFQIVHAPTYLLLDTNYKLGDYIPASDIYLIVNHAVSLGYQVKICPNLKKENIPYPLPAISNELADLMIDYPSDLKMRTNGMVFEQRAYLMSKCHHEVCQDTESKTLLKEAEYWLVNYAREVITQECNYLPDILTKLDDPVVRSMAINTLMVWQPNWKKAISQHAGSKFEAGNNEFEVISYYHNQEKKGREGVMVLCRVTKNMNNYPEFPTFPLNTNCTLGTYQVENALNRRLA
ncbi:hypothetical protein DP113_33790 (plasmid) [Brasilonema octagenarum UFV-E1]|uniref:Uncharacterized protein n=3 Tax=Scytonemataceae TaxID=1182 RepID=A0A856MSU0_9CYAN|nr:hypothetical protein [Brasilonema sennae]NMF65317.1 hypothetical protein [Brasilonema octagenarum UFV-OR1]QDL12697.1 hypothetical protein DP114_33680 [Brasilonema sennae CENA114]QDL19092.1 hypothetical protein DP113_33790 [Brasilonema octagenarum UFV-E1]